MKKSRRKGIASVGLTHDDYTIELARVEGLMERLLNVKWDLGWIFCSVIYSPHDWDNENLPSLTFLTSYVWVIIPAFPCTRAALLSQSLDILGAIQNRIGSCGKHFWESAPVKIVEPRCLTIHSQSLGSAGECGFLSRQPRHWQQGCLWLALSQQQRRFISTDLKSQWSNVSSPPSAALWLPQAAPRVTRELSSCLVAFDLENWAFQGESKSCWGLEGTEVNEI